VKEGGVVRDAISQPLGFRTVSFDPNTGFSLNGQHLDLHGVNRLQERAGLGWALTNQDQAADMALIQEVGATVIRGSQYEHSQAWYDLADQNGILMWAEHQLIFRSNASAAFHQNSKEQFIEHIRQSYNHPSIFLWSLSNEPGTGDTKLMLQELQAVAHAEDPSRPTTLADDTNGTSATGVWDTDSLIPDQVGFNHYAGWYGGVATNVGPYVDICTSRSR
jgi:beta-galactosidase